MPPGCADRGEGPPPILVLPTESTRSLVCAQAMLGMQLKHLRCQRVRLRSGMLGREPRPWWQAACWGESPDRGGRQPAPLRMQLSARACACAHGRWDACQHGPGRRLQARCEPVHAPGLRTTGQVPDSGPSQAQAANGVAAEALLGHLNDCVRALLRKCSGYLCQQADNAHMVAFASSFDAIIFCLRVRPLSGSQDSVRYLPSDLQAPATWQAHAWGTSSGFPADSPFQRLHCSHRLPDGSTQCRSRGLSPARVRPRQRTGAGGMSP